MMAQLVHTSSLHSILTTRSCVIVLVARIVGLHSLAAGVDGSANVGIVTMQTPDIMSYAKTTELENRRYAATWGYGFHVVDHAIDKTRVPHWSKVHAVQLFLPEYDFVLWIDADAVFFDYSRRIEDVMGVAQSQAIQMWAQDIWPDYPSIHRKEIIDTGVVLFRNSLWTRNFLLEMYHLPSCQDHLNWTEQYCFTLAYNENLLGMQERMSILPTPTINHHVLPSIEDTGRVFILHLAGRPAKARASQFEQVYNGRANDFQNASAYGAFWRFRELFARHRFAGIAQLQVCLFGIGDRNRAFMDALLFHFPYFGLFTIARNGAPQLYSQLRASEHIGDLYPDRMAHMDINEYQSGVTREGKKFVEGFYCDIFVFGVESARHLPSVDILGRMAFSGLEPYSGDQNKGFGFSPLRDAYVVVLHDGCDGDEGAASAAAGFSSPVPAAGHVLDLDDEDGSGLVAACDLLGEIRSYLQSAVLKFNESTTRGFEAEHPEPMMQPALWSIKAPGEIGIQSSGDVALARVARDSFPAAE